MSCLSGLGVICLVCLGCLSFLPTSNIAGVLCTCSSTRVKTFDVYRDDSAKNPSAAYVYATRQGMRACNNNYMCNPPYIILLWDYAYYNLAFFS